MLFYQQVYSKQTIVLIGLGISQLRFPSLILVSISVICNSLLLFHMLELNIGNDNIRFSYLTLCGL